MEGQEGPILHLKMEKGPNSGQNLDYKPGSKIQIGRVIRGNTIAIKDEGISSKHLSIHFESGLWVINDLGSSNGTFLNKIAVDPSRPAKLNDGDVIKIGEETSIKVGIEAMGVDPTGKSTRRNTRRKGLGVIDEDRELGFGNGGIGNVGVGSKRTTRSSKRVKSEAGNVAEVESFSGIEGNTRRTRGSRKVESVKNGVDNVNEAENVDVERESKRGPSRTRGSKEVESVKNGVDNVNEAENVDVERESKHCPRRTRGSRKADDVDNAVEENEILSVVEEERQKKPSPRRTRGCRKVECVKDGNDGVEKTESFAVGEEDRPRKPSPRRTRGSKRAQNVKLTDNVEEAKNSVTIDVDKEKKVCSRRTRGSRKEEDVENLHENAGENMELKQLGKGKRKVKGSTARMVRLEEDEVMEKLERDQKDCEEAVESSANEGVERNMLEVVVAEFGREVCEASVSNVGVNMSEDVHMEEEVDLEEMTLGGWFDYLEVNLPKQIIDATEAMILGMKQKTEKYQEFMLQQKNAKDCDGIPKG